MKVGYVRISTREQNTARQDVLMEKLGVEKVYTDKLSGKNTERPELQKMMDFVREGDMVVVESFSRFARNLRDLLDLTETLEMYTVYKREGDNFKVISSRFGRQTFCADKIKALLDLGAVNGVVLDGDAIKCSWEMEDTAPARGKEAVRK